MSGEASAIPYRILQFKNTTCLGGCLLNHSFMKKDKPTKEEALAVMNEHAAGTKMSVAHLSM